MNRRIKNALENVRAEKALKDQTVDFLCEKIRHNEKKSFRSPIRKYSLAFVSILFVFFIGRYSYGMYYTQSAFVNIDVNPAIELSLNRFDRVIETYAYNDDGAKIISALDITHRKYNDAMSLIVAEMLNSGYITGDGLVSVTVQTSDNGKEAALLDNLQNSVSTTLQNHHSTTDIEVYPVDSDTGTYAHDLNITPAKYLAILELQKSDPTITVEECAGHSIKELRDFTMGHRNRHHGNSANDGYNENDGYGENDDSGEKSGNTQGGIVAEPNNAFGKGMESHKTVENEHDTKMPSFEQKGDDAKHGKGHH